MQPRKITGAVVVITGASSGIGKAAAHQFASRGARLVLAARRKKLLEETAAECRRLGAETVAVQTDVTREPEVDRLAKRAVETFGRIDVWINNAAVAVFARIEDTPIRSYRRLMDTNFFGSLYGARAALRQFHKQGDSGVLIQNISIVGKAAVPILGSYVTTKYALLGLAEVLRQEVLGTDIHVCSLVPASMDTPIYDEAANYTGRAVRPVPPVYAPEKVARAMVGCAEDPKREVYIGSIDRLINFGQKMTPHIYERVARELMHWGAFQGNKKAARTDGNLFRPLPQYSGVRAGWLKRQRRTLLKWGLVTAAATAAPVLLARLHQSPSTSARQKRAA